MHNNRKITNPNKKRKTQTPNKLNPVWNAGTFPCRYIFPVKLNSSPVNAPNLSMKISVNRLLAPNNRTRDRYKSN
jgi:hypothetical protein